MTLGKLQIARVYKFRQDASKHRLFILELNEGCSNTSNLIFLASVPNNKYIRHLCNVRASSAGSKLTRLSCYFCCRSR